MGLYLFSDNFDETDEIQALQTKVSEENGNLIFGTYVLLSKQIT